MIRSALLAALVLAGCQTGASDVAIVPPATTVPTTTTTVPEDVPVVDLELLQITANQAVEIRLWDKDDDIPDLQAPLLRNRDALIRVMVDPTPAFVERRVRAVLEVENNEGSEFMEEKFKITGKSKQDDLDTSFNFKIPGDLIKANTKFHVNLFEVDNTEAMEGEDLKDSWHSGAINPSGTDVLTLVLVPVRYNADGSGRLPDTSENQLRRYRDWMMSMYPVEDVVIEVAPVLDWNQTISPGNVNTWSSLLDDIADMRSDAQGSVDPNTYYYGLFNPRDSYYTFCAQGCILGLSNLAWSANDPWYRSSMGIGFNGFNDVAASTLVHEVGHAHGRYHADCGGASGTDPSYPYGPNAVIGTWGYDIVRDVQYAPDSNHDMMGYCEPMWISDYQYYNIYLRIAAIGQVSRSARIPWQTYKIDDLGKARIDKVRPFVADLIGVDVEVELLDANGDVVQVVDGLFSPISHGYGGTVMTETLDDPRIVGVRIPDLELN